MQLQMVSIAVALKEIGYDIEVCVGKRISGVRLGGTISRLKIEYLLGIDSF